MYFYHAVPALRRGYHCLLFDGPGQGRALIEQGLHIRPDWENVVRPVVDHLLTRPEVAPQKIALTGWSFGGFLAPRAASGEHRLAACIADPGQFDIGRAAQGMLATLGVPQEELARFPNIDPAVLEGVWDKILSDPYLSWTVHQRALWVHGVATLADWLRHIPEFTVADRAGQIRCPTLVCQAENDPIARQAGTLYEALTCEKAFLRFTAAEGADDHCEMEARSLFSQRAFDWLDETLSRNGGDKQ
jgi:alpha-beta hydrolase superfamily lysophospholipase